MENSFGQGSLIRYGMISQGEHAGKRWLIVLTKSGDYGLFIGGELYVFASSLGVVLDELHFLGNA